MLCINVKDGPAQHFYSKGHKPALANILLTFILIVAKYLGCLLVQVKVSLTMKQLTDLYF